MINRTSFTGFELGFTGEVTTQSGGGSATIQSSKVYTGNYAAKVLATGTQWYLVRLINGFSSDSGAFQFIAGSQQYCGFHFLYLVKPAADREPIATVSTGLNGSTKKFTVCINSSGILEAWSPDYVTLWGTGTTPLVADRWYRIETQTGYYAADPWEVRLDGITEVQGSGNTLAGGGINSLALGKTSNMNGQSVEYYFDDAYFGDDATFESGTWPGEKRVISLPLTLVSNSGWTCTDGLVDEVTSLGDLDANTALDAAGEATAEFALDVSPLRALKNIRISEVKAMCLARDFGATTNFQIGLRDTVSGIDRVNTAGQLVTTYTGRGSLHPTPTDSVDQEWTIDRLAQHHFILLNRTASGQSSSYQVRTHVAGVHVLYDVLSPPTIGLSTTSLHERMLPNTIEDRSLVVQNTGSETLNYTVSDNQSWITCSRTSGSNIGGEDVIEVTLDSTGLSPGVHSGSITVTDSWATNDPQIIPVTLEVYTDATFDDKLDLWLAKRGVTLPEWYRERLRRMNPSERILELRKRGCWSLPR